MTMRRIQEVLRHRRNALMAGESIYRLPGDERRRIVVDAARDMGTEARWTKGRPKCIWDHVDGTHLMVKTHFDGYVQIRNVDRLTADDWKLLVDFLHPMCAGEWMVYGP